MKFRKSSAINLCLTMKWSHLPRSPGQDRRQVVTQDTKTYCMQGHKLHHRWHNRTNQSSAKILEVTTDRWKQTAKKTKDLQVSLFCLAIIYRVCSFPTDEPTSHQLWLSGGSEQLFDAVCFLCLSCHFCKILHLHLHLPKCWRRPTSVEKVLLSPLEKEITKTIQHNSNPPSAFF